MDDSKLLDGCLRHDCSAWTELLCLIERLARGLAAPRFNLDQTSIEDVIQSTVVELLKNDLRVLRAFKGNSQLSTYVAVILQRVAGTHARVGRYEIPLESLPDDYCTHYDPFPASIELVYHSVFDYLSNVDGIILRLVADGYSMEEIANLLTRTQGEFFTAARVRKHKERATKRLIQSLHESPA